jgi:hypothetical protein
VCIYIALQACKQPLHTLAKSSMSIDPVLRGLAGNHRFNVVPNLVAVLNALGRQYTSAEPVNSFDSFLRCRNIRYKTQAHTVMR